MATPVINNLLLPNHRVLVLPDETGATTGTIEQVADLGSVKLDTKGTYEYPTDVGRRILFIREMATEVEVNGVEYLAMHEDAVVGLIP